MRRDRSSGALSILRPPQSEPGLDLLTRGYLLRRRDELYAVIDRVRVFSKRYSDAVDELEEVEELLGVES